MKRLAITIAVVALLAAMASPAFAGVGEIRIEPHGSYYPDPVMLTSPATFNISTTAHTAYQPNILLVMTDSSHSGLTGNVTVTWTGGSISFRPSDFTSVNGGNVLLSVCENGAKYTVSSLKDHIGDSGILWYAYGPILTRPLNETAQEFTITLPSTHPRTLVYAWGKDSPTAAKFNMKVPPTRAGFVVPELGPILMALASFGGFAIYAVKQRKRPQL